jgi:hypothetical protein
MVARSKIWRFSDRDRAIALYVKTGSFKQAALQTGIPRATISAWKARDPEAWDKACRRARGEEPQRRTPTPEELSAEFLRIAEEDQRAQNLEPYPPSIWSQGIGGVRPSPPPPPQDPQAARIHELEQEFTRLRHSINERINRSQHVWPEEWQRIPAIERELRTLRGEQPPH